MSRTRSFSRLTPLAAAMALAIACSTFSPPAQPTTAPVAEATATTALPISQTEPPAAGPIIITGAGDITAVVDEYRALLGTDNGGDPGAKPDGRREINWDGVPDEFSAPNGYPVDFFNAPEAPRARGIIFSTPGTGLQVSADLENATGTPPRFGNINPAYADAFKTFSAERLFSPLGSNIVDLTFFVPGTNTPALVRGFGAVYTDVDTEHTAFEYFDREGNSLGAHGVPIADNGLSFLGVDFGVPIVARVRVAYGTVALGPNDDPANDVAVMDDFIFGEPQADPAGQPVVEVEPTVAVSNAPAGLVVVDGEANRDLTRAGFDPGVAAGPENAWITWAEDSGNGAHQIFVSELVDGFLTPRGGSLNWLPDVAARQPTITFAGEGAAVPWVAWAEPIPNFGNVLQIFASRFDPATGLWEAAGQDRGTNEPSLNFNTGRDSTHPFIFAGSDNPTEPPAPWVAWEELSGASNFVQIFVSKGVKDETALGGLRWDFVGENRFNDEPTLNIDPQRDALHPTAVFAETANAVPWVTWHEVGGDRPGRVFTARGVANANVAGGFKWINVPPCGEDETTCSLNLNPLNDAQEASTAAGSVTAGEATVPWIAWAEVGPSGKYQILVSRLDPTTRNSFLNVGGSLNVDQNQNARHPFISFVGTVPYVAWLEEDGSGQQNVQVRHLASDPQTGTWALDTPEGGFNLGGSGRATALFASGGRALFFSIIDGDPATEAAKVLLAQINP